MYKILSIKQLYIYICVCVSCESVCIYPVQLVCTFFLHISAYIIIYLVYSILSCTFYFIEHLFIFILISFFSYLYLCIFSCVVTYNCTVHGADLTYISLLVIFCIIVHVTNTNLESWMVYMGWLCMRCCEVTLWTGISMLLLPCVGGVHTDLYSSCTRTDSSSSASVWGRAQRGNLHLLSLLACFYHHWGNASLPDFTVLDLCCVGKKSESGLFENTQRR